MAFHHHGQPAANAEAVSPPAVEYAKGKLLDPKTTIGPIALDIYVYPPLELAALKAGLYLL